MATTLADVRAGVDQALAGYVQALDDGRTDEVVATFCPDGSIDFGPIGAHEGTDALRAAYAGWVPRRPQRHLVLNTHVTRWDDQEADAVSDVVLLLQGKDGWRVQLVGRYHDTLHQADGTWRFHHRRAEFVADPA